MEPCELPKRHHEQSILLKGPSCFDRIAAGQADGIRPASGGCFVRRWHWLPSDSYECWKPMTGRPDYMSAHDASYENRAKVVESTLCGCFHCLAIFEPGDIKDWTDDDEQGVG